MSKRKKKKVEHFVAEDFCAWMDGYCDAFADFSDGEWQAACEGVVNKYNNEYGTRIDHNDAFHIWLQAMNK